MESKELIRTLGLKSRKVIITLGNKQFDIARIKSNSNSVVELQLKELPINTALPIGCVLPPDCTHITEGKLRSSDWVWDIESSTWVHPKKEDYDCVGSDVACYYCVARRVK